MGSAFIAVERSVGCVSAGTYPMSIRFWGRNDSFKALFSRQDEGICRRSNGSTLLSHPGRRLLPSCDSTRSYRCLIAIRFPTRDRKHTRKTSRKSSAKKRNIQCFLYLNRTCISTGQTADFTSLPLPSPSLFFIHANTIMLNFNGNSPPSASKETGRLCTTRASWRATTMPEKGTWRPPTKGLSSLQGRQLHILVPSVQAEDLERRPAPEMVRLDVL